MIFSISLIGDQKPYRYQINQPTFCGSFLSFDATNLNKGQSLISPYLIISNTYGEYTSCWSVRGESNTWGINSLFEYQYGITDSIGLELFSSFISNFREGESATHFEDSYIVLGFQISNDTPNSWIPDFRIHLEEIIPTGKYQHLDPKKLGVDLTGQGSFQTGVVATIQKQFLIKKDFLRLKWALEYLLPAPTHVSGLNAYGGGRGTKGKAYPGQSLAGYFSGEYLFGKSWEFAFDFLFLREGKSSFSGKIGRKVDGSKQEVGLPDSYQLSVSPQMGYNFNANSSLLFGIWASLAGKNSSAFFSGVFYYYIAF